MSTNASPPPNTYVFRAEKTAGTKFTRVLNSALQDERLSYRARGLLAIILSLPTTWEHSAERLAKHSPDGQDAVRSALRELVAAGYAEMKKFRSSGGRMVSRWFFRESPPDEEKPHPVKAPPNAKKPHPVTCPPDAILPSGGQPGSGQPGSGLCPLYETTVVETTVVETTNTGTTQPAFPSGDRGRAISPLLESLALTAEGPFGQLTATTATAVRVSLAEIMKVNRDLTPAEIERRATNYRAHFPQATLTARALAKHWARCATSPKLKSGLSTDICMDELQKRYGANF